MGARQNRPQHPKAGAHFRHPFIRSPRAGQIQPPAHLCPRPPLAELLNFCAQLAQHLANVRVSARRGVPRKVSFSSVSRPATMSGKTAFFEPETAISPVSLRPPEMTISSIVFSLSAPCAARLAALRPSCFAALRRFKFSRKAAASFSWRSFFYHLFSAHCSCLFLISFGQLVMLRHHTACPARAVPIGAQKYLTPAAWARSETYV